MKKLITHFREGIYYGGKLFVLLELLTVVAVLGVLAAVAVEATK
jgi:Tfp pilus assembly protein FimT